MDSFELEIDSEQFTSTRIYKAIKQKSPGKLLNAIQHGENMHIRDQEFGSTYLHLVVNVANSSTEERFVPMIYQLSNAGIEVNAKDYKNRTALELAIYRELQELMVALIRVGVDPTEKDYKSVIKEGESPFEYEMIGAFEKYEPGLWRSVSDNDTSMVYMLVNSWCRVNTAKDGKTLTQFAKETKKSQDLISTLDDYEVTIEFVHATLAGDEKRMLEFLMDAKPCDPNIMDISFQERWSQPLTPRSLRDTAISMGHTHVLHLLPEEDGHNDPEDTRTTDGAKSEQFSRRSSHNSSYEQVPSINNTESLSNKPEVTKKKHRVRFQTNSHLNNEKKYNSFGQAVNLTQHNSLQKPDMDLDTNGASTDGWYYFHQVDDFVNPCYFPDPEALQQASLYGTVRGKPRFSNADFVPDYDKNWNALERPLPQPRKSKQKKPPPVAIRKNKYSDKPKDSNKDNAKSKTCTIS